MRCFVAIPLPETIRQRLRGLQQRLRLLDGVVRWTHLEQMHLTLKFLGEVPEGHVPRICATTQDIAGHYPPFELSFQGLGCFPPRGPVRVIWVGLPDLPADLLKCQAECEAAFAALGFEKEGRRYSPHLTIGRVNDAGAGHRIRNELQGSQAFDAGTFTAGELVVFQSELRRSGSVHTPLARAPFAS